jgi:restriction system protein
MNLPDNTLFAILLRSRWWVSLLVAVGVFAAVRAFLETVYALFAALPFIVIAGIAMWKQRHVLHGARLEAAMGELQAMTWEAFAVALEQGYRRQGYTVKRVQGAADFELEKAGKVSLVAAKRWKASRTGIEPLKELAAAGEARGAAECVVVLVGTATDNAQKYAQKAKIKWLSGTDLVRLTRRMKDEG